MKTNFLFFLPFGFLSLFLLSCDSDVVYDEFKPIAKGEWHRDSIYTFSFEIQDTLSSHNIYISNRISGQYPYSRMYLFVQTSLPDQKQINDTLECVLAKQSGQLLGNKKWIGKGFGNLYYNKIPYKINIRFPVSGKYEVTIEQGMRDVVLPEVFDIGLRVEKAK